MGADMSPRYLGANRKYDTGGDAVMSRYYEEVREEVEQGANEVFAAVSRFKAIAKRYPSMIRDEGGLLSEARDKMNELVGSIKENEDDRYSH